MLHSMVTTEDNPYDPFDEFDDWEKWDTDHGYFTMNYLMRIAQVNSDLGSPLVYSEIDHAVDEIVSMNLTGNYKKVTKDIDEVETY